VAYWAGEKRRQDAGVTITAPLLVKHYLIMPNYRNVKLTRQNGLLSFGWGVPNGQASNTVAGGVPGSPGRAGEGGANGWGVGAGVRT